MKYLVIGDIHNGPNFEQIEAAISSHAPDLTIFLGDYFDQWGDTPEDVKRTAEWLRESLLHDSRVHLWGNHDLPYALLGSCPGWSQKKQEAVQAVMSPDAWRKLRLWYHHDEWLFSHAGLSGAHSSVPRMASNLPEFLNVVETEAWTALHNGEYHWIWAAGKCRGGNAECGGPLWCDLSEFRPIGCVNQVLGHTPLRCPVKLRGAHSQNWWVDVSSPRGISQVLAIANDKAYPVTIETG